MMEVFIRFAEGSISAFDGTLKPDPEATPETLKSTIYIDNESGVFKSDSTRLS